jgi:hypothetical protein
MAPVPTGKPRVQTLDRISREEEEVWIAIRVRKIEGEGKKNAPLLQFHILVLRLPAYFRATYLLHLSPCHGLSVLVH